MPAALGALVLGLLPSVTGFGAITSISIFGISFGATTVGGAVIAGALIGLSFLMPRPGLPKQPDGSQPLQQAIPPRRGAYGKYDSSAQRGGVRLSGVYMLYEVKNGISYDVLALAQGPVTFHRYFLHDDEVTLDGSGIVQAGDANRYGGSNVTFKTRTGLATETAYSEITTPLSSIWSSSHRGDGIASIALICNGVKADKYQEIYPHQLPQPSAVVSGFPVWDPRDGAQSRGNPATWQPSANPVLQLLDYMTHSDHGMGLDYDFFFAPQIEAWKDEADLCDELVNKVGGTEKRYQSNGWYSFDTKPSDVIGAILSTCDGWLDQDGDGAFVIRVGVYSAPTITITEKHRLAINLNYGVSDEETVNELTLSFTSPLHKWQETPVTSWRDEASISASGVVRSRALAMEWVQSHSQVRRLAKRAMQRLNPAISGTVVLTLYGLRVLGQRWVRFQFSSVYSGLTDAVVEIKKARVDLMQGRVTVDFVVIDPDTIDAWTPASEEGPAPTVAASLTASALPTPENVAADGSPATNVSWDDPARSDLTWRVRHRPTGGDWTEQDFTAPTDLGTRLQVSITPAAIPYEVQVASVGASGTVGTYAPEPPLEVT